MFERWMFINAFSLPHELSSFYFCKIAQVTLTLLQKPTRYPRELALKKECKYSNRVFTVLNAKLKHIKCITGDERYILQCPGYLTFKDFHAYECVYYQLAVAGIRFFS